MVLPKLPCIWGEGGGSPHINTLTRKLSINNSNVRAGYLVSDYAGMCKTFNALFPNSIYELHHALPLQVGPGLF